MKKCLMGVVLFGVLFGVAQAENSPPPKDKDPAANFEQHKAEMLKNIEKRLAKVQEHKACVQAAKNNDELRVCRDKARAEAEQMREHMRERMGAPK